jgi:hypothetical protein
MLGLIPRRLKRTGADLLERLRDRTRRVLEHLIFRLDTTRFLLDRPQFEYQPIPWAGVTTAAVRGEATVQRWQAIRDAIEPEGYATLKDVGSCAGYFCISAAETLGLQVVGIEAEPRHLRIARYGTPPALRERCRFVGMTVSPETVGLLPRTDVTLLLAVWHWFVRIHGLEVATRLLVGIWDSTDHELFFESGEEDTADDFGLPFGDVPPREWLSKYLAESLPGSVVEVVGAFATGDYAHYDVKGVKRHLFRVRRKGPAPTA